MYLFVHFARDIVLRTARIDVCILNRLWLYYVFTLMHSSFLCHRTQIANGLCTKWWYFLYKMMQQCDRYQHFVEKRIKTRKYSKKDPHLPLVGLFCQWILHYFRLLRYPKSKNDAKFSEIWSISANQIMILSKHITQIQCQCQSTWNLRHFSNACLRCLGKAIDWIIMELWWKMLKRQQQKLEKVTFFHIIAAFKRVSYFQELNGFGVLFSYPFTKNNTWIGRKYRAALWYF